MSGFAFSRFVASWSLMAAPLLTFVVVDPIEVQAQNVFSACYVPLTGTVYRIRDGNLKTNCTTGHIEFNWTDGAGAVRTTDPAGGDLSGVFGSANVVRLLGRALSTTAPQPGHVLSWNGSAWIPTTPPSGSGAVSGREIITTDPALAVIPAGRSVFLLNCPPGKVAISGGARGGPVFSIPSTIDPRTWEFHNPTNVVVFAVLYVLCVNGN